MIVTDACGDNNGWCRDNRFHLDLHTTAVNRFEKNGVPVNDMLPLHFNNRKINWEFVESPNYSGDIDIYFMQNAQYYWPAIMINHLRNGISKVEQYFGGQWVTIENNSDMGQAFILKDFNQPYKIRVYDGDGNLINNGREYSFSIPSSCCSNPATKATVSVYTPPVIQSFELEEGWNLISFNVIPSNKTIESVFSTIINDVVEIKNADAYWKSGQNIFFNSIKEIEGGSGYLVYMSKSASFSVTGSQFSISGFQFSLKDGWNLIGCPFQAAKPFATLFSMSEIESIKNFEGFWQGGGAGQLLNIEPGKGYFLKKL